MIRSWISLFPVLFGMLAVAGAAPEVPSTPPVVPASPGATDDHEMEELGVNPYTAPSIPMLLEELSHLRPIPYPAVKRSIPEKPPAQRALLALHFGALIADGFLVAVSERPDDADRIGRMLMKIARGMGVAPAVTRHASSLGERAARKDWANLRKELVSMQEDVEEGLMKLRDEEIAHLIAFGGWVRGLEIYSRIAEKEYEPARAAQILQPDLIDYFRDRLRTLSPGNREQPWVKPAMEALDAIHGIASKPEGETLSKEEVARVRELASGMFAAILAADAAGEEEMPPPGQE